MFKEIAINPLSVVANYNCCCLINDTLFGFERGRYIIADSKSWAEEAFKSYKNLREGYSDIQQEKIDSLLELARFKERAEEFFLLPSYRSKITGDNWQDWWQKQTNLHPFDATLAEQTDTSKHIYSNNDIWGYVDWKPLSSPIIDRTRANNFIPPLLSLIRISSNIVWVDKYFGLSTGRNRKKAIKSIKELLSKLTNNIQSLIIITANNNDSFNVSDFQGVSTIVNRIKIIYVDGEDLHDRLFITDVGAIKATAGFIECNARNQTPSEIQTYHRTVKEEIESYVDIVKTKPAIELSLTGSS